MIARTPQDAALLRAMLSARRKSAVADAVPAQQRHAGDDSALSADSQQLIAAWHGWRGSKSMPQRSDMDLVSIARLMPQLLLLELFSSEHAVFRLVGNDIERLAGLRLMGRDYLQLVPADQRANRGALLLQSARHPFGLVAFYTLRLPDNSRRELQVCLLPLLANEPDAPPQLLGVASNLPASRYGESQNPQVTDTRLHLLDLGAGIFGF